MQKKKTTLLLCTTLCMILLFIVLLTDIASAIECGSIISKPSVLNKDITCSRGGFKLINTGLDCQGHAVFGAGFGDGVRLIGNGTSVRRCTFRGFSTGVYLDSTSSALLEAVAAESNSMGIFGFRDLGTRINSVSADSNAIGGYFDASSINPSMISYKSNQKDFIQPKTPAPETANISPPSDTKSPSLSEYVIHVPIPKPNSEELSRAIIYKWQADFAKSVLVSKQAILRETQTDFVISLRPQKNVQNLAVTEFIPKLIAPSSKSIVRSNPKFLVLDEDLLIRFDLGDVESGTEKNVTYTIDHRIARDLAFGPFTIITVVEEISPDMANVVSLLSVLFAIALALYHYLQYKTGKKPPVGLYTALYIASLVIVTGLGYIQTELVLPPKETAYGLSFTLAAGIGYMVVKGYGPFRKSFNVRLRRT